MPFACSIYGREGGRHGVRPGGLGRTCLWAELPAAGTGSALRSTSAVAPSSAPAQFYLLCQFPAPTAVKTPLSGAVKLVLASIWLYPRNKLLCLSPRLEHLLRVCTSASDPAHGSPDAPWRSSELPQAVCSHSRAVPGSDTTPAHLQARRCKGEAGDTLPGSPSFAFQPQAAVSASVPPNPRAVLRTPTEV